ncbi:ABC transporter D family member 2, chloroplastic [Capsicum chinense]|nr:ABC transporter D family member 2, chloroplastic [Capsicum chinense]
MTFQLFLPSKFIFNIVSSSFSFPGEFDDVLDSSNGKGHRDSKEEIQLSFCLISCSNGLDSNGSMPLSKRVKLLHVEHLTVQTPSEATLIKDLSFEIFEKDHLLVTGPSGSGKTSLLRAVAGLWSFGNGAITVYVRAGGDLDIPHSADVVSHQVASINETVGNSTGRRNSEGVIFLPQKPYMVLGTLRQQLLYPIWTEDSDNLSDGAKQSDSLPFLTRARDARCVNEKPKKPTSDDLIQVLNDVSLGHLLSRFDGLDSTHEWSSVLSLGEQQRLAFGRLLLSKPTLALLDESTSALDEANEVSVHRGWNHITNKSCVSVQGNKSTKLKGPCSTVLKVKLGAHFGLGVRRAKTNLKCPRKLWELKGPRSIVLKGKLGAKLAYWCEASQGKLEVPETILEVKVTGANARVGRTFA